MGYFLNGFAFAGAPDFRNVASALPSHSIRGYRHTKHPLWLVDIWENPRRGKHWPFTTPTNPKPPVDIAPRGGASNTIELLRAMETRLKNELDVYGSAEVGATLHITQLSGQRTLFFKADDDLYDFACLADKVAQKAQYRMGPLKIDVNQSVIAVEPMAQDDGEPFEDYIAALRDLKGLTIRDPVEYEGGFPFYGSVLAVWPREFGDPEKLLGLGTWDPLVHLDQDCTVVFERLVG